MIITRTPYRVSLFGGGTDYPKWYRRYPGSVLGMAIDKYCYISIRRLPTFFEHKHRIVYSIVESVKAISEIKHPAVRAVLSDKRMEDGVEIHHDGDLPARSGIGSSSSFTVGLIHAVHAFRGQMVTKDHLAQEAMRIEREVNQEDVGSQDQIWASYGGFNRIDFHEDAFHVAPLIVPRSRIRELVSHLVIFFTGLQREAQTIARQTIANIDARHDHLLRMHSMVDEAEAIICNPDRPIIEIGQLLDESWRLKRELASDVSTPIIDELYEEGRKAGATGGKLLGAGGGGFMLFFASPDKHHVLRAQLSRLIAVDFDVDDDGSSVVLYQPNGLQPSGHES